MNREEMKLWIINSYTSKRKFKRKKNRIRSWIFYCSKCNKKCNDDAMDHYWYRDGECLLFCSEECAYSLPVSDQFIDSLYRAT